MILVRTWATPPVGVKVVITRTRRDRCKRARFAARVRGHKSNTVDARETFFLAAHTRTRLLPVLRARWESTPGPGRVTRDRSAVRPALTDSTLNAATSDSAGATDATPKVAVTEVAALSVTTQVLDVPVHPPLQPVYTEPEAAVAVRVTVDPIAKYAAHVAPQLIPAGTEVTEPAPEPSVVTLRRRWVGSPDDAWMMVLVPSERRHVMVVAPSGPTATCGKDALRPSAERERGSQRH